LANEYRRHNVVVNNVCSGYTATAQLMELSQTPAEKEGVSAQPIEDRWASQTPLGRIGTPEQFANEKFANVVAFLASERARYVTGVSLGVDGGVLKRLY
jgi:3-oxoacyl-[acyl-carrier protein] reductase